MIEGKLGVIGHDPVQYCSCYQKVYAIGRRNHMTYLAHASYMGWPA